MLRTEQDFYDLTDAYLARAASEGVRHSEIMFDPQAHLKRCASSPCPLMDAACLPASLAVPVVGCDSSASASRGVACQRPGSRRPWPTNGAAEPRHVYSPSACRATAAVPPLLQGHCLLGLLPRTAEGGAGCARQARRHCRPDHVFHAGPGRHVSGRGAADGENAAACWCRKGWRKGWKGPPALPPGPHSVTLPLIFS